MHYICFVVGPPVHCQAMTLVDRLVELSRINMRVAAMVTWANTRDPADLSLIASEVPALWESVKKIPAILDLARKVKAGTQEVNKEMNSLKRKLESHNNEDEKLMKAARL